jgi:hypothetical protein
LHGNLSAQQIPGKLLVYLSESIFFTSRRSGLDANHRPLEDQDGGQLSQAPLWPLVVVLLIKSHFTGRSALDSVTGKFGDAVAQ